MLMPKSGFLQNLMSQHAIATNDMKDKQKEREREKKFRSAGTNIHRKKERVKVRKRDLNRWAVVREIERMNLQLIMIWWYQLKSCQIDKKERLLYNRGVDREESSEEGKY